MTPPSQAEMINANVNPYTGLATDYLNLFNEAIMLFEMSLDMPDMVEELTFWRPLSYIDHFEKSGFEGKDVVIAAYLSAPEVVRKVFDDSCHRTLSVFAFAIELMLNADLSNEAVIHEKRDQLSALKGLVNELDSHIHGNVELSKAAVQDDVDALF